MLESRGATMTNLMRFAVCLLAPILLSCNGNGNGDGDNGPLTVDNDGDGYCEGFDDDGDPETANVCSDGSTPGDCDDTVAAVNPGAVEVCDDHNVDEDCDGNADDADTDGAEGELTWYADVDGDGYGDSDSSTTSCDGAEGEVDNGDDCDDTNDAVNPGATEVCDDEDVDEDCDGNADDADVEGAEGKSNWYPDADGDGHGEDAASTLACDAEGSRVDNKDDCDDSKPQVYPGAPELCDGQDTDCNPGTDEAGLVSFEAADGTWSDWTPSGPDTDVLNVVEGGTLWLCAGTHDLQIDVDASDDVTIKSSAGAETTILDGGDARVPIVLTDATGTVTVEGLTVQHGFGTTGGALRGAPDGELVIRDCVFQNNVAGWGGAVYVPSGTGLSSLEIHDSEFLSNTGDVAGGAVYLLGGSLDAYNTSFWTNNNYQDTASVAAGGALWIGTGAVAYLWRCDFWMNESISPQAFSRGGAIETRGTSLTLEECTVRENDAGDTGYGGGIYVSAGTVLATGTQIVGNTSKWGGGVQVAVGTFQCEDSVGGVAGAVLANVASGDSATPGGGVLLNPDGTLQSTGCDWGVDADDNSPTDISGSTAFSRSDYENDETFSCTHTGCT